MSSPPYRYGVKLAMGLGTMFGKEVGDLGEKLRPLGRDLAGAIPNVASETTKAILDAAQKSGPGVVKETLEGLHAGAKPLFEELQGRLPRLVGESAESGVRGAVHGLADQVRQEGGGALQGAREGLGKLVSNRYVQGAAGTAAALYGAKKLYDAYDELKFRRLAGEGYAAKHKDVPNAEALGRQLAARRLGAYQGRG